MADPDRVRTVRRLGELLAELRRQWGRQAKARSGLALPEALEACLGRDRAAAVGFASLQRGTLTLTVDSSALLSELESFQREALLSAIQASSEGARVRALRLVPAGGADGR